MNVAFDPWIPVATMDGKLYLASLEEIFISGQKYADLAVRPHERVALMRLFLCVAHAALDGPKDYDEWCEVPKRLPEAARKYLADWRDSFELFHEEKPWLQVAGLKGVKKGERKTGKTSPISLLEFEKATGNNSTLFDHTGQLAYRPIVPERTVLNLVTFQNFSSGGGSPVAQWKTTRTSQVGNPDAPCLSQSMAHCLLRGKALEETLLLNLPTYETVKRRYRTFTLQKKAISFDDVVIGKPVWEDFPVSPNLESKQVINATRTYLGRLVPISRWIKLIKNSDQMYCCNGFKYDTFKDGFAAEPTASVRVIAKYDKKGGQTMERKVVGVDPTKALWRELNSLLVQRSAFGLGGPLALDNAPSDSSFDFHVCSMTRDQASMDIAVESVFHISPSLFARLASYQDEVIGTAKIMGAEGHARKLRRAIEVYRWTIDSDWLPRINRTEAKKQNLLKERLAQKAFLSYWTTVEKNLPMLMAHIEAIGSEDATPTRDKWRKMLFKTALDAYKVACGQETPRQMRAFARGWQVLERTKIEPKSAIIGREMHEQDF